MSRFWASRLLRKRFISSFIQSRKESASSFFFLMSSRSRSMVRIFFCADCSSMVRRLSSLFLLANFSSVVCLCNLASWSCCSRSLMRCVCSTCLRLKSFAKLTWVSKEAVTLFKSRLRWLSASETCLCSSVFFAISPLHLSPIVFSWSISTCNLDR